MNRFTLLLIFTLASLSIYAQSGYKINRATGPIVVDGVLDDDAWSSVPVADDFQQYFPFDSVKAVSQTEFQLTYDEEFLYFSAKMYNISEDRPYVTPSLRRDYRGNIDGITLMIDPFQDNTNAFQFGINAYGVQREGLISNGGQRRDHMSLSWDNKWTAQAVRHDGYWVAEAAIPFKTLRYKEGLDKWNINVYRIDTETGERSTWTPIPRNILIMNLAFVQELQWDEPLEKPGPNISLIPYVSGSATRDYQDEDQTKADFEASAGFDAKFAVTPSMNLDITVNPDFSQVEVDQQVTNLDRFELFFPERRQFFLENEDLFSSSGHPFLARPFFSRRIGIARDTSTGVNVQNQIHYGARLSGKINNDWRLGILNMQEAKIEDIQKLTTNYTVGVLQRKVFKRSNITGIFVNKDPLNGSLDDVPNQSYNRVAGLDYNIQSADAKWQGKVMYHQSFDDNPDPEQFSHAGWISYNSNTWIWSWAHVIVGENYDAQVGYVPRKGIYRINPDLGYNFFTKGGFFNRHQVKANSEFYWNKERKTDHDLGIEYEAQLNNTGRIEASFGQQYTYLSDDFDPTNTGGEPLLAGTDYYYWGASLFYRSDYRKTFGYTVEGYLGQYFNGDRLSLTGSFNYRMQPYAAINMIFNYNKLKMPAPQSSADLYLIGPRVDVTFSKKVFLTSFFQYNSQIQNMNINARFQYRFKPVSDLFIVYTDNYGTERQYDSPFQKKNRALILKLTYWFNL